MDPFNDGQIVVGLNNPNLISEEFRTRVYNMLADVMIGSLEKANPNIFTVEDSQQSAEFIIPRLDDIKTYDDLFYFLKQLSERWPVYDVVYSDLKKENLLEKVQSELQQLH